MQPPARVQSPVFRAGHCIGQAEGQCERSLWLTLSRPRNGDWDGRVSWLDWDLISVHKDPQNCTSPAYRRPHSGKRDGGNGSRLEMLLLLGHHHAPLATQGVHSEG